jgi:adenylate cyclase class IV
MGHNNREIESKLQVEGLTNRRMVMVKVHDILEKALGEIHHTIEGDSRDVYWAPPAGAKADFVRVRYMAEGRTQVTLKHQDKGNYLDRVEIDLEADDADQAIALMKNLLGDPLGMVRKKYTVFFLDKKDTTISVYKVINDDRVFIEVEALSQAKVDQLKGILREGMGYTLTDVDQSLFQIFLAPKLTASRA